jgi:hypothetical protein
MLPPMRKAHELVMTIQLMAQHNANFDSRIKLSFFVNSRPSSFLIQSSSDIDSKRIKMKILQLLLFLFVGKGIFGKIVEIDDENHEIVKFVRDVMDKVDFLFDEINREISDTNPVVIPDTEVTVKEKMLRKASIVVIVSDVNHPVSSKLLFIID